MTFTFSPIRVTIEKEEFGDRRIDCDGIVGPIDPGKDRRVAQMRQRIVGGKITVRIDARRLNPAIPDVAKDVGGQERVEQQHIDPQHNPDAENQPKGAALSVCAQPRALPQASTGSRGWPGR